MQKSQRRAYKRSHPNLDSLFGHVFDNLLGEPLSPMKISIFYLVRILFETHFGHLHLPSIWEPFTAQEKQRLFHFLFGLMTSPVELTYDDLRVITREAFGEDREICLKFYAAMEQIACNQADVNLAMEDEFYTNKYAKDPNLDRNDPKHEAIEHATKDTLHFSSPQSFLYRWLKKVLAQWNKEDTNSMFQLSCAMRIWILSGKHAVHPCHLPYPTLPHFFNCSSRARETMASIINGVQNNPHHTFEFKDIPLVVDQVKLNHRDVYEAHLLEGVVAIQKLDFLHATQAIKKFFDLSMFELTDDVAHFARTHRLGVPTHTPLMYGPLLQARVCRLFGDDKLARQLLQESLQQTQIRGDDVAHQLANTELHILDFIGGGAVLEDKSIPVGTRMSKRKERRVVRKTLKDIDDLHGHHRYGGPCCRNAEEDFELVHELDSYGKMMMIVKSISQGRYCSKFGRIAETGLSCPMESDMDERSRKVSAYGYSLITSNMVRNGYFEQAISSGEELLRGNMVHQEAGQLRSEPIAVAMANIAYGYAAQGNYDKANETVQIMAGVFPDDVLWQCHRHAVIAGTVINFESNFLYRKFEICKELIQFLNVHSQFEKDIRLALVYAATGFHLDSFEILSNIKLADVYTRIRVHMQAGCFHTSLKTFDKAKEQFEEAMELAMGTTIRNIRSLIIRRTATMEMLRGSYEQAATHIKKCSEEIEANGSYIEKCCYFMTKAKIARAVRKDPRLPLKHCLVLSHKRWPGMQKMALAELAAFHGPNGLQPNSSHLSNICERLASLEADFPGSCDWVLL